MQESQPLKSGEEQKFQVALTSKRICDSNLDEVKEVLRLIMLKIGIRGVNLPNDVEKMVLIGHIIENFYGHTLEEIKLAFDMAINGKLECETNSYENFSCLYFSNVMNAYRKWATQAHRELKTETPPEQRIYTYQEILDLQRKDIEIAYQQMRNGRVPYGLPEYFKEILVKDGLMKHEENVSDFFVQRLGKGFENIYVPNDVV